MSLRFSQPVVAPRRHSKEKGSVTVAWECSLLGLSSWSCSLSTFWAAASRSPLVASGDRAHLGALISGARISHEVEGLSGLEAQSRAQIQCLRYEACTGTPVGS